MKIALSVLLFVCAAPFLTGAASAKTSTEIAPGVLMEKNVPIKTSDGNIVYANVFRPAAAGKYPAILFMSPYGKDVHIGNFHPKIWPEMKRRLPGLLKKSSGKYHTWETLDPELWVPQGYILIRIDSAGSGKSPGVIDIRGPKEVEDYYDAIEWAAVQPWCSGKVGMAGISYYSVIQWKVASLQPPHLAGFIAWEGLSDNYRESQRHGGILSNGFSNLWWQRQVVSTQHGNGNSPFRDLDDGAPLGGSDSLSDDELAANRIVPLDIALSHPLHDSYHDEHAVDFSKITAPFLSAANWGGLGLHLRGNIEGFVRAGSKQKWLETHGGDHILPFFSEEGQALQKSFFDQFLKGMDNGWESRAPIMLRARHPDEKYVLREETTWPLTGTQWTQLPLDAANMTLGKLPTREAIFSYSALENAAEFRTSSFEENIEIAGPLKLQLWISSSTADMDIFATLQLFDAQGDEVTFEGASEPAVPITQGWLRASQRKLDSEMTTQYRPFYSHDEQQPLIPGKIYQVQVEIWPTSIVIPEGYSLGLRIEGKDFSRSPKGGFLTGSGLFLHTHPEDRNPEIFAGINTIHTGGAHPSYLLIPVIPSDRNFVVKK